MEEKLSWEALDHIKEEKSSDWFWIVGAAAIAGAILSILFSNILLALLILLGVFASFLFAHTPAKMEQYELNRRGVRIGETLYPYRTLKSFYVVDEDGYDRDRILIKSERFFMPILIIPIENKVDMDDVRDYLLQHLEEEEMIEPPIHHLMGWLGF